jgi:spermidine/putrescine transport system substrate-binding protein
MVAAVVLVLAGCGSTGSPTAGPSADGVSGTLRIFAYTDAFDPDVFDGFTKANPAVKVQKAEISGDTAAVAKLKGGFKTDVVNTCAGPIDQEIQNNSLAAIDTSRIKDWDKVYPFFKDIKGVQADGKVYMIPMVGGVYGLTYRPSALSTPPTSWMDLYASDKRLAVPDDPLQNIVTAGLALGFNPPQSMTAGQLEQVKDLLIKQKAHVVNYYSGDALQTLWQNDEVDLVPDDRTLVTEMESKDTAYAAMPIPLAWTCGYSIANGAENLDAVYAYLNYALSPAVQVVQATNFAYLVSNQNSAAALPADVVANTGQDRVEAYRDAATLGAPADMDAWTKLWEDVKAK